jgi:8-oxo-dGTP diphosphatase
MPKPPRKSPPKAVYTYEFPRAMTTVDGVVFGFTGNAIKILLVKRAEKEPDGRPNVFGGWWALPGGFVNMDEDLEAAIRREMEEETGVEGLYLEQLYTFGNPKRDPRGRVISIAYYALVKASDFALQHGSDADETKWFDVNKLPKLAFDHAEIVEVGLQRIRAKVRYQPIGFELLADKFTLVELQKLYEAILQRALDKRNFRRKILSFDILEPLNETVLLKTRNAQLYRFDKRAYQRLIKAGFNFEI